MTISCFDTGLIAIVKHNNESGSSHVTADEQRWSANCQNVL